MAAQTLRTALSKAESSHPGITHDLIMGIIRRAELNLDMNESVLRLQGAASDYDGKINLYVFILTLYIEKCNYISCLLLFVIVAVVISMISLF